MYNEEVISGDVSKDTITESIDKQAMGYNEKQVSITVNVELLDIVWSVSSYKTSQ